MVLENKSLKKCFIISGLVPTGIYSVFTLISYLCEKSGQYTAAGMVLISAAVVLAVYFYLIEKSLVSFPFLISFSWIAGEGLSAMQLSSLQSDWSDMTWISFWAFYVMFILGYAAAARFKYENKKQSYGNKYSEDTVEVRLRRCIAAVSGISFTAFVTEAVILGYIPVFADFTHAYDHFHITGIHYFTVSCMFTHSLTLIYVLKFRSCITKKKVIFLTVCNILSLSIPIMCVSKFQFIITLALPVLIFMLMKPDADKKKLFMVMAAIAAAIIGMAVFMTLRRNYEEGYLDSIFQMKDKSMPMPFQYAYMYIANNYSNFNCLTKAIAEGSLHYAFGLKQLFPVFAFTGLKFIAPQLVNFPIATTITEMNTLTIIYDAYYDFGITGVILFGILFGIACRILTNMIKKSENPVIILLYAQAALYVMLSFFSAWFSIPTTWFWFGITIIMYLYVHKRKAGQ